MKNIIGYIRVSTTNQDLIRQKQLIKDYADANGLEVTEYICEKVSGATDERDGYKKLLTITRDYADGVVMSEVSRFSREDDIMKPLNQVNTIIHNGLTVVFMDNDIYDTQSYKDQLSVEEIKKLADEFAAAAKERDKIVRRMTTGRRTKFVQYPEGLWGKPPFGYKRVINPNYQMTKTPRSFKERDENAEVVKKMYQWIIDGASLKDVAFRLRSMGIRNHPTLKNPEGNDFDESIVASIIHNPIYKGVWTLGGATVQWDGIVSAEVWEKAQIAISNNRIRTIIRDVNFNPLKGIIKCPCGKSMYIINDRKYKRYRCAVKKNKYDQQICNNGGTGYEIVLKCVWNAIICTARDIQFANETSKEIKRLKTKVESCNADIVGRKRAIDEKNAILDKLSKSLFSFPSSMVDKILVQSQKAEEDIESLKKEIENLITKKNAYQSQIFFLEDGNTIKPDIDYSEEEKAEVFQRLLERVTYYDIIMHQGFLEVVFKNGTKRIYLILSAQKKLIQLPTSFKFDPEERKVIVELSKLNKEDDKLKFTIYTKSYDIKELMKNFKEVLEDGIID